MRSQRGGNPARASVNRYFRWALTILVGGPLIAYAV